MPTRDKHDFNACNIHIFSSVGNDFLISTGTVLSLQTQNFSSKAHWMRYLNSWVLRTRVSYTSLLLHYQSHVDNRYKQGLLRTMLGRAHSLSSSWSHFSDECDRLKTVFSRLKYPKHLIDSAIKNFVDSKVCDQQRPLLPTKETDTIRVVLPFKDQTSANFVKGQLRDLSLKVNTNIQPVFVS